MAAGYFITGTGTDVGKTVVTAALARFLMQSGVKALPVKPVQSGAIMLPDGRMDSPDGEVYRSAGAEWDFEKQCPFIFEPACSPHLAAKLAGAELDPAAIAGKVHELEEEAFLLVEGAGGIMVPLNEQSTMLDLMRELSYPVILVSENKLGTINETLLSITALKDAGLSVAGVVMTAARGPEPSEFGMAEDNIRTIEHFSGVKVLAAIPYIENWNHADPQCWKKVDRFLSDIEIPPAVLRGPFQGD